MEITETQEGPVCVLAVKGRLDHDGAGQFQDYAVRRVNEGVRALLVDFNETTFVASMGIRALIVPSQAIRQEGGRFAITGLSVELKKLFEMTGLYQLFKVFPTVADAAAAESWS